MDNRNIVIAAILGLVLLEVLTLHYKKQPIEDALLTLTTEALQKYNAPTDVVSFDGRDATLAGIVPSEEEKSKIEKLVSEIEAVRVVYNRLEVVPPEPVVDLKEPEEEKPVVKGFKLSLDDNGALLLQGLVHDETSRNRIVASVLDAFPTHAVENELQVDEGELQPWIESLLKVISTISIVKQPEVTMLEGGAALLLKGEVQAEFQKVAVLRDLESVLPASLAFSEQLQVVAEERDLELVALEKRIQDLQTTTRIQFKISTAHLADLSKEVLDQVAEILNEAPDAQIEVQGHTDNLGKEDLNLALSQDRADAVRAYLITKGINASRLTAVGYGSARPVATNSTRAGRIANRRVVFSLKGGS